MTDKHTTLTIRLPQSLLEATRQTSKRMDVTISQYVRRALRAWVAETRNPKPATRNPQLE